MPTACTFSFNIAAWQAVSDKMFQITQWQAWSQNAAIIDDFAPYQPKLAFLPVMQRRRLSLIARLVCDATWDLATRFSGSPVVYASHDGEQNRSFDLWLE